MIYYLNINYAYIHIYIYFIIIYIYIYGVSFLGLSAIMRKSAGPSSAVPRISTGRRESRLRGLGALTIKKGG